MALVDGEIVALYDEIMLKDPAERSIAEEAFIEYVAERLVAEVGGNNEVEHIYQCRIDCQQGTWTRCDCPCHTS